MILIAPADIWQQDSILGLISCKSRVGRVKCLLERYRGPTIFPAVLKFSSLCCFLFYFRSYKHCIFIDFKFYSKDLGKYFDSYSYFEQNLQVANIHQLVFFKELVNSFPLSLFRAVLLLFWEGHRECLFLWWLRAEVILRQLFFVAYKVDNTFSIFNISKYSNSQDYFRNSTMPLPDFTSFIFTSYIISFFI